MLALALIVPLVVLFLWATYPWELAARTELGEIKRVPGLPESEQRPTTLTLMTWNMGYAYGVGSEGTADYQPRDAAFYTTSLERVAETIRLAEVDVVLLQEVDLGASRSHGVHQLAELARLSGLPYYAEAVSWRTQYVPFPYWPFQRQFGGMRSGGGILSRWPIKKNEVHLLAKPASKAWWYNLFYLYRYFQVVKVQVFERELTLVNLHLEAFDQPQREEQARELLQFARQERPDFIGGDFNMVPDGAMKRSGFSNPADRYEGDKSYTILRELPHQEVVQHASYLSKEEAWFTFPSNRPDRRLDYIYHAPEWSIIRAEVVGGPHSEASDHLPLKAVFNFFAPEFIRD